MAGVLGGPFPPQGPQHPGPLPSRLLHPDDHLHQPPFYTPVVQSFFPYQWPSSSLSVSYGGFQGLGLGMMPPLLLPAYEVPGYMNPQLHMVNYRNIAPTSANLMRRSNFQNGVPLDRVMVNSEVQTEPVRHSRGQMARSDTCSESGRDTGCESPASTTPRSSNGISLACPEGMSALTQNTTANAIESTQLPAVPKNEVIQAERLKVKRSVVTSKLKGIQNTEISALTSFEDTNLLRSSLASEQTSDDILVCSYRSLAFREDKKRVEDCMVRYSSKRSLSSCTEVNVVRTPTCKTHPEPNRSGIIEVPFQSKEVRNASKNICFKILHLPFDQCHYLPFQLDASIWSVESLLPHVPSKEWVAENGLITPEKTLSSLTEPNIISQPNSVPVVKNHQICASAKRQLFTGQLEASFWSVESLMPYVPSEEWMAENCSLTTKKRLGLLTGHNGTSNSVEKNNQSGASVKAKELSCPLEATVLESLIPYAPSDEWMAENGSLISKKTLSSPAGSKYVLTSNSIPVGKNQQTGASAKRKDLPTARDASVWSVESLLPFVPSREWMVENGFLTPQKSLTPQKTSCDVPSELQQSFTSCSARSNQQTNTTKYASSQLEASVWSEFLMPYVPSTEVTVEEGMKTLKKPVTPTTNFPNIPPVITSDVQKLKKPQICALTDGEKLSNHLQTDSQYHPSTSWLADLGNVYFYSKLPVGQQPGVPLKQANMPLINSLPTSLKNEKFRNPLEKVIPNQDLCLSQKCNTKVSPRFTVSTRTCHSVSCSTLERNSLQKRDYGCRRNMIAEHKVCNKKKSCEGFTGLKSLPPASLSLECCTAKTMAQTRLCNDCIHQIGPGHVKYSEPKWINWGKSDGILDQNKRTLHTQQKDTSWKGGIPGSKRPRRVQKQS